jgi:hypothetical protein
MGLKLKGDTKPGPSKIPCLSLKASHHSRQSFEKDTR